MHFERNITVWVTAAALVGVMAFGILVKAESTCANVRCGFNTTCVMKTVQCFKAPCNSVPSCVPLSEIDDSSSATTTDPDVSSNATNIETQENTTLASKSSCDTVRCSMNSTCEMKQPACFAAPCNPIPTCVDNSEKSA